MAEVMESGTKLWNALTYMVQRVVKLVFQLEFPVGNGSRSIMANWQGISFFEDRYLMGDTFGHEFWGP